MPISLKEQLRQVTEAIHYFPPDIDVRKKARDDSEALGKSTQLFYDFYAMELLHRLLGSSKPPPVDKTMAGYEDPESARKMKAGIGVATSHGLPTTAAMFVPWQHVEEPLSGVIVPHKMRELIDRLYEEVTIAVARKILAHLRLTLIQEFRYLVEYSSGWTGFRQKLLSLYNKNKGKISKEEFEQLVNNYIPGMKGHIGSVKRLLLFSKYYSAMGGFDSKDPADTIAKIPDKSADKPEEPEEEPVVSYPTPKGPPEPEPIEPPEGGWDVEPTEVPPGADWESDKEADYKSAIEKEKTKAALAKKKKLNEDSYAAGRISPSTIKKVNKAVNKAGLKWEDVLLAYNNIHWGGAIGGPKWGAGVEAFLKLVPEAKLQNAEEIAGLVDHIYDLEHNTGDLLNKGGMFVGEDDLNRRAKVTHIARYLPNVSPQIKRVILQFLKYLSPHPEVEANIDQIVQSPTQLLPPEQEEVLTSKKFLRSGTDYKTEAPFLNKKNESVQREYTFKYHTNGKYSLSDDINADVRVFNTFDEAIEYIKTIEHDLQSPHSGSGAYYKPTPIQSEKEKYMSAHTKTKLDADKEKFLLNTCKMVWRPKPGSRYYKGYLPSGVFQLYAFSDGTFLASMEGAVDFKVFPVWAGAAEYCQKMTVNALPNKHAEEAKAWLGLSADQVMPVTPQPSAPDPDESGDKTHHLEQIEKQALIIFVSNSLPQYGSAKYKVMDGMDGKLQVVYDDGDGIGLIKFTVGKSISTKLYEVSHQLENGNVESWDFPTWKQAFNFIKSNLTDLVVGAEFTPAKTKAPSAPPSGYPPVLQQFPEFSATKAAYSAHLGIDTSPKHSIRLTKEDEDMIKGLGFEPKMFGGDLWYIHKNVGDSIKFYPNNNAKIMFAGKGGSKGSIGLPNMTIDKALAWLQTKYEVGTKVSPVNAPAVSKSPGGSGAKIGPMFEKHIVNAGFQWDAATGQYVSAETGDKIRVAPYPKSTVSVGGEIQTFNDLPSLVSYLNGDYLSQKKSKSDVTAAKAVMMNDSLSTTEVKAFESVAEKYAKYSVIPVHEAKGIYAVVKDTDSGNTVYFLTKDGGVYSIKDYSKVLYSTEIFSVILNNFGALLSKDGEVAEHEGITVDEYEKIKDVAKNHKHSSGYNPGSAGQTPFAMVYKPIGETGQMEALYSVGAIGNYYQINDAKTNSPIKSASTFENLLDELNWMMGEGSGGLSEYEKNLTKELVGEFTGLSVKEQPYAVKDEEEEIPSLLIYSNMGSLILAINKTKNVYHLYRAIGVDWEHLYAGDSFAGLFNALKTWLHKYFGEGEGNDKDSLTLEETEGVNSIVEKYPAFSSVPVFTTYKHVVIRDAATGIPRYKFYKSKGEYVIAKWWTEIVPSSVLHSLPDFYTILGWLDSILSKESGEGGESGAVPPTQPTLPKGKNDVNKLKGLLKHAGFKPKES